MKQNKKQKLKKTKYHCKSMMFVLSRASCGFQRLGIGDLCRRNQLGFSRQNSRIGIQRQISTGA